MDNFLEAANTLLEVLTEYDTVTDRFDDIDFSGMPDDSTDESDKDFTFVIDDVESIIQERDEIVERATATRNSMAKAINAIESDDMVSFIKKAFNGDGVSGKIKDEQKRAVSVIERMLVLQKRVVEKDKVIGEKLSVVQEEIKKEMKSLQNNKKKLDFLNTTATAGDSGTSFNI